MTERRLPLGFNSADENDLIQKGAGGLWVSRGSAEVIIPGRFLVRTIYTSGTALTHNLNARTTKFRVYGQGGGGGGGGAFGATTDAAVGESGQAGGYFDHLFAVFASVLSFTYTVGQGGAAGVGSTLDAGGDGTNTQVTYNAVVVGARRGLGGTSGLNNPFPQISSPNTATAPIVGSAPDIEMLPQAAEPFILLSVSVGASGRGGSNVLARGGAGSSRTSAGGTNGRAGTFGGGGSGGIALDSVTTPDGGAGGAGILIVEEYS